MAAELLDGRSRVLGIAGTVAVHVLVIAALLLLAPRSSPIPAASEPGRLHHTVESTKRVA